MTEEQKNQYEMFKRVLTFLEMHKKELNEYPELWEVVEKFKVKIRQLDEIILSSSETTPDDLELIRSMDTLLEFAKQFGDESKN